MAITGIIAESGKSYTNFKTTGFQVIKCKNPITVISNGNSITFQPSELNEGMFYEMVIDKIIVSNEDKILIKYDNKNLIFS